jgi:hypothetical protein
MFSGLRDATHSVDRVSEEDVPLLKDLFIYLPTLSISQGIQHRMI